MATPKTRFFVLLIVPVLILLLPLGVYFVDSAAASDKVARNVSVSGVDVGRLTQAEAEAAVDEYTDSILTNVVTVEVNGERFSLHPADVDMTFDNDQAIAAAMNQYKDGITDWFTAWTDEADIIVVASFDEELMEEKFREWELASIPDPAFEGAIEIVNETAVVEAPADGRMIDRDIAPGIVEAALTAGATDVVGMPIATSTPGHTTQEVQTAAADAEARVARGVTLTNDEYESTFVVESSDLGRAFKVAITKEDITYEIDPDVIMPLIDEARPDLELDAVSARWETVVVDDHEAWNENYSITDGTRIPNSGGLPSDDAIRLIDSKLGTTVNEDAVYAEVTRAALDGGAGELQLDLNKEPKLTTEEAEAYGTLHEVSEFTTYMPGTNRASNIKLMADLVDDTVVWPGQTFSVNDHVGQRTLEKGFKYDCAIVSGIVACEEDPVNIGGGVSQFGTTIFNAIYFGCYEDIEHRPHSIYFTKYPEGREATLGYPSPDVAFRNDSDAPVIIRTSYTNRSVTVTFFGNRNGETCGTVRSDRSNETEPETVYEKDEEDILKPGQEKTLSGGTKGWNVTNTRIFYDADGDEKKREAFFWRYKGEKNVILVHACDTRVGGNGNCTPPTTTTSSTVPPETTTTTEAPPKDTTTTTEAPPETTTTTAAPEEG